MRVPTLLAALTALVVATAGCGNGATAATSGPDQAVSSGDAGPSAGMCAADAPDCVDTVIEPAAGADGFVPEAERETARAMVGLAEDELAPDVRVGRRGGEQMMLTEDYVLGRKTVELDDDGAGTFRVVAVTVELPDGPETVTG
ncbi:hypothetical protein [Egicoccus sp. AB-alg2]|uniref:hypothetical protein n=1 Tax=Egicoccus sp. AB-alg2 TaxID=3242693 RepID=UPI00359E3CDA